MEHSFSALLRSQTILVLLIPARIRYSASEAAGKMNTLANSAEVRFNTHTDLWTIDLVAHGTRLGKIWGVRNGSRLLLSDITVEDPRHMHEGIGSRLLEAFLARARESGITEVWGSVTHDDIRQTPHLLDWYQKRGFSVFEPDDECLETAIKKIVIKLPNNAC